MDWTNSKVSFEPWQGSEYRAGIAGRRVLILGESHWHSCDVDPKCADENARADHHRSLTFTTVNLWKDHGHSSPVSRLVPRLFGMTKPDFWQHVVFYNYLQTFAGPGARCRPKEEQWTDDSAEASQTVLDRFEPDRILVLGKDTWTVR